MVRTGVPIPDAGTAARRRLTRKEPMMSGPQRVAPARSRELVGKRFRCASPFPVERGRIREFARAVQAYHPAHWHESAARQLGFDAVVAPPTFATLVWQRARSEILARLLSGHRIDRVVHVDQTLEIDRPLLAGDVLECEITFESVRHLRSFDVVTVTGVLTDQLGAVVQRGSAALLTSTLSAGDGAIRTARPAPVTATPGRRVIRNSRTAWTGIDFDALVVGTELPTADFTLAAGDIVNYGLAVGDPEPGTVSDRFLSRDRPALVVPSMLVSALATGYVSDWTRDPAAVTKYWVEYSDRMHHLAVPDIGGAGLEFNGRVVACDRRRRVATIAIDAKSQGAKLFGYATAEVNFTPDRRR